MFHSYFHNFYLNEVKPYRRYCVVREFFNIYYFFYKFFFPAPTPNPSKKGVFTGYGFGSLEIGSTAPALYTFYNGSGSQTWYEEITSSLNLLRAPNSKNLIVEWNWDFNISKQVLITMMKYSILKDSKRSNPFLSDFTMYIKTLNNDKIILHSTLRLCIGNCTVKNLLT